MKSSDMDDPESPLHGFVFTPEVCLDADRLSVIELASALEVQRALRIVDDVSALPVGGKDSDQPTAFEAGYQLACAEIGERLRTQVLVLPEGVTLPLGGPRETRADGESVNETVVTLEVHDNVEWTRVRGALATFLCGLSSNIPGDKRNSRWWESFIDGKLAEHGTFKALREHLSTSMTYLANCDDAEFDRRIDAFMAGEPAQAQG